MWAGLSSLAADKLWGLFRKKGSVADSEIFRIKTIKAFVFLCCGQRCGVGQAARKFLMPTGYEWCAGRHALCSLAGLLRDLVVGHHA